LLREDLTLLDALAVEGFSEQINNSANLFYKKPLQKMYQMERQR